MQIDLHKYQYVIEKLAPIAHDHNFHERLVEETSGCDEEIQFLLTMEIKRLAQPCIKSIDLRLLVEDECEVVFYDGVKHYLSAEGNELFQDLIERFENYTVGVNEGVVAYFAKQRDIDLGETKKEPTPDNEFSNIFINPTELLLSYPSRKDERILIDIEIRVFLSASVLINARALDLSKQGLRINLEDETELTLIKGYRPVQIVFTGLNEDAKLSSTPIEYRISGISKGQKKANIHLSREYKNGPKAFNDYIDELFKNTKHKACIETSNTQIAIESKVYEQAFATSCTGLSLFINTGDLLKPFVQFACYNEFTLEIFDYWQDENNKQTLGYLFGRERLKKLLIQSDSDHSTTIYSFNHISDGKVYFYSATEQELEQNTELRDVFLSYASRKASWKVYKVVCNFIDPSCAHLPSSLPNGVSKLVNQSNRGLAPKLLEKLTPLTHMLTLSDITHSLGQQCYQQRNLEKDKIKLLSLFGHAKNRPPTTIDSFKFAWFDKRREKRYKLRTEIQLLHNKQEFTGISEDISVQGLRLELESTINARIGDVVEISFPKLQEITREYTLNQLPYKVVRVSDDRYVIHLQGIGKEDTSTATSFFTMLIDRNRDRLQVLPSDLATPGLRQALRVMQAKYSPQVCIYTRQQKDLHYPIKTALNVSKTRAFKYLGHDMPANYLNISGMFQTADNDIQYIGKALNQARKQKRPISHEIFIIYDLGEVTNESAVRCVWEQDILGHVEKYNFIREAMKSGEFFACRVTCTEKHPPITTMYDDELKYLRKKEPELAKSLDALAWSFSGQVFLTDVTAEVLLRYRLIQH